MRRRKLRYRVKALFFPERCVFCGNISGSELVCGKCLKTLPFITGVRSSEMYYSTSVSAMRYDGPVRKAVLRMKFDGQSRLAEAFGEFLADALERELDLREIDIVTWVPLGSGRFGERGYNQSEIIAKTAADLLGLYTQPLLIKVRDTPPQSRLHTLAERIANVDGAYEALDGALGQRILVVDDILTTGATMSECAKMLLQAGAESVTAGSATLAKRSSILDPRFWL